jgi:hypothetical protein
MLSQYNGTWLFKLVVRVVLKSSLAKTPRDYSSPSLPTMSQLHVLEVLSRWNLEFRKYPVQSFDKTDNDI